MKNYPKYSEWEKDYAHSDTLGEAFYFFTKQLLYRGDGTIIDACVDVEKKQIVCAFDPKVAKIKKVYGDYKYLKSYFDNTKIISINEYKKLKIVKNVIQTG